VKFHLLSEHGRRPSFVPAGEWALSGKERKGAAGRILRGVSVAEDGDGEMGSSPFLATSLFRLLINAYFLPYIFLDINPPSLFLKGGEIVLIPPIEFPSAFSHRLESLCHQKAILNICSSLRGFLGEEDGDVRLDFVLRTIFKT